MITPCEIMAKEVLPLVRAYIAKQLVTRYAFNQSEVARRLGVTQATISWYIAGKRGRLTRGTKETSLALQNITPMLDNIVMHYSQHSDPRSPFVSKAICEICNQLGLAGRQCKNLSPQKD